jgi:hypothetical protein
MERLRFEHSHGRYNILFQPSKECSHERLLRPPSHPVCQSLKFLLIIPQNPFLLDSWECLVIIFDFGRTESNQQLPFKCFPCDVYLFFHVQLLNPLPPLIGFTLEKRGCQEYLLLLWYLLIIEVLNYLVQPHVGVVSQVLREFQLSEITRSFITIGVPRRMIFVTPQRSFSFVCRLFTLFKTLEKEFVKLCKAKLWFHIHLLHYFFQLLHF